MYYIKMNNRFIKADENLTKAKRQATKIGNTYPAIFVKDAERAGVFNRVAVRVNDKWG